MFLRTSLPKIGSHFPYFWWRSAKFLIIFLRKRNETRCVFVAHRRFLEVSHLLNRHPAPQFIFRLNIRTRKTPISQIVNFSCGDKVFQSDFSAIRSWKSSVFDFPSSICTKKACVRKTFILPKCRKTMRNNYLLRFLLLSERFSLGLFAKESWKPKFFGVAKIFFILKSFISTPRSSPYMNFA